MAARGGDAQRPAVAEAASRWRRAVAATARWAEGAAGRAAFDGGRNQCSRDQRRSRQAQSQRHASCHSGRRLGKCRSEHCSRRCKCRGRLEVMEVDAAADLVADLGRERAVKEMEEAVAVSKATTSPADGILQPHETRDRVRSFVLDVRLVFRRGHRHSRVPLKRRWRSYTPFSGPHPQHWRSELHICALHASIHGSFHHKYGGAGAGDGGGGADGGPQS